MERAEREIMAARHLFVEMLPRDLMVSECLRSRLRCGKWTTGPKWFGCSGWPSRPQCRSAEPLDPRACRDLLAASPRGSHSAPERHPFAVRLRTLQRRKTVCRGWSKGPFLPGGQSRRIHATTTSSPDRAPHHSDHSSQAFALTERPFALPLAKTGRRQMSLTRTFEDMPV